MSALHRLLPLPASRRTYSFFSSRSGGGRYFNPAKSPKPAVVAPKKSATPDAAKDLTKDQQPTASTTPAQATSSSASPSSSSSAQAPTTTPGGSSPSSSSPSSGGQAHQASSSPTSAFQLTNTFSDVTQGSLNPDFQQHHLAVGSKDFKMHQFFALHRPLLLISQPSTLFRSVPLEHPITGPVVDSSAPLTVDASTGAFGPFAGLESSIDADAEAARQLTRALTMNQAGAAIAWENTLRHLGLDPAKDADRVGLQERFDKEWNDVLMDSTKRKRRKKMKKHKLKKRRRATRAERMRLK